MASEPLQPPAGREHEGTPTATLRGKDRRRSATIHWEVVLLSLWFLANLGMGFSTVHQYGVSFDEPNNYRYAADTLAAYKTFFGILGTPPYNASYDGHGPAFMAAMLLWIRALCGILPGVFQFTEPLLLCAYIGPVILICQVLRSRIRTDLLLYMWLGFAAPVIGWQLLRSPIQQYEIALGRLPFCRLIM